MKGRRMTEEERRKAIEDADFWDKVEGGFVLFGFVGMPLLTVVMILAAKAAGH